MAEKGEKVGGAAAYSGGQVWVRANHVAQRYGLLDSIEDTLKYVQAAAGRDAPSVDEALCERWLQGAGDAAQWLEQMGVIQWELIPDYPDYYYPTLPGSRAAGRYLTGAPFDGQLLGKALGSLHVSPHFPAGITYSEIFEWGGTSTMSLLEQPLCCQVTAWQIPPVKAIRDTAPALSIACRIVSWSIGKGTVSWHALAAAQYWHGGRWRLCRPSWTTAATA